ncbi:FliM/FliN family flagellar motor switch protein [Pelagibius marinus]|uniref:FliM/FliN family flagellar motor switch protein n=1 Tax=Pelagibius marinus TaxID=2762760 RepID=UPI001D03E3F4|nr:FliM/FliN family flagellar motor switch protein [Pelagibius marinus]
MPDEDEKKAKAPAEESEAEEPSEDGDADQDAMMAEWEAMAAEGEAEEGADEAAPETPADTASEAPSDAGGAELPVVKMPAIHEVSLEAYAILGTASMPVSQLLRMGRGAVVELETGLGDEIEMRINDQLVAKGEVVVVEDRIAIEITEIVKREGS